MKRRRRRVAVITGTRAEYGLLKTVMRAIDDHPDLTLQVAAVGMHLLKKFGATVRQIERDGWRIDARVRMQSGSDDPLDQALGLGRGVAGIARFLDARGADIVLVLGDRIEAMAGTLAAVTTGRPVAHLHGGDAAPGDFDDALRHAITKLAHLHLTASRRSMRRVLRLGEPADRVFLVGAPGLDDLRRLLEHAPPRRGRSGVALIVHHAHGRPRATERRAMTMTLDAVASLGLKRLIVYPNSDRGHEGVIEAIRAHEKRHADGSVVVKRSLPREAYLKALIDADVLVGNSSGGIIEAPSAGTPSVDVGERQAGREAGGPSVIRAGETFEAVREGIQTALRKRPRRGGSTVYGDGRVGPRVAAILAQAPPPEELLRKSPTP